MKKNLAQHEEFEAEPAPAAEGGGAPRRGQGRAPRRKKTWFDHLLTLLIIALVLGGAYLLLRPTLVRWNRQRLAQELQDAVDKNVDTQISYDPNANRFQEAEYDYYELNAEGRIVGATGVATPTTLSEGLRYMTPIGRIEVPRLKVNIPLIKELDYYAMYYAASHYEPSPLPFQPGNCAIFLHRDSYDDYDFTHAERLLVDDPIYITYQGQRKRYSIVDFNIVTPDQTLQVLAERYQSESESYITLVTCDPPAGSGAEPFTHRLLITARLNEEKPAENSKKTLNTTRGR